jgi:hypothetical protein
VQFTALPEHPGLLELPWSSPLEEWPADLLATLPKGVSRHVVRFVRVHGTVYAVKESPTALVQREYRLLRALGREGVPVVRAVGVVLDRRDADGNALDAALVTRHLRFSLPYRAVFSRRLLPGTSNRLLDALVELLVRLHLAGFAWGDCSLSNTLFRRDAETFAAYLVDAETGQLQPDGLSDGQRAYDVEIAATNAAGELLDLAAGDLLDPEVDPVEIGAELPRRYGGLWDELNRVEVVDRNEWVRIENRIRRLHRLGYDVDEVQIVEEDAGRRLLLRTAVVEPGHHRRRLRELTGIEAEEHQARRLLADLAAYQAAAVMPETQVDEHEVARHWVHDVFEPVVDAVPAELRGRLEPAQVFHEVLEHRWYLSERAGGEVSIDAAARDYVNSVLAAKPEESAVLGGGLSVSDTPITEAEPAEPEPVRRG